MAEWRANHEEFWHSEEVRAEMGADFQVRDDTLVVVKRFRLLEPH